MNIEPLLIHKNKTLLDAIKTMDRAHSGIVLVVDSKGVLVGLIADADVRRILIEGNNIDQRVEEVMRTDPIVISAEANDSDIVKLLQSEEYKNREPYFIPGVDKEGRPIKLYSRGELLNRSIESEDTRIPTSELDDILILGGAGYIGSVLVRNLLKSGYNVTILDKFVYGEDSIKNIAQNPRLEIVQGDTRHIETLVPMIRRANAVVHLAELVGDPLCGKDPQTTFEVNYLATCSIARICSNLQINRFIYLSSCSVYGASDKPDILRDEDSNLSPVSLYAKTKINSERVILSMSNGNFSPCILRLGTVYGISYRPRFDLVVNAVAAKAVQDKEFEILGGSQWRPHIHVDDVAKAIQMALESPIEKIQNQIFNIVGENYRIDDVGRIVAELIPEIKVIRKDTITDSRNYRISGEKAEKVLGFLPSKNIREGIREIADAIESGLIQDYKHKMYHNITAFEE